MLTAAETQHQLVNRQGNPWNPWGWVWATAVHPSGEPYQSPQDLFVDLLSQIPLQPLFYFPTTFSLGPYFCPGGRDFLKWHPWDKSITGIGISPGSSRISWYFTCFLLLGNFFLIFSLFWISWSEHPGTLLLFQHVLEEIILSASHWDGVAIPEVVFKPQTGFFSILTEL